MSGFYELAHAQRSFVYMSNTSLLNILAGEALFVNRVDVEVEVRAREVGAREEGAVSGNPLNASILMSSMNTSNSNICLKLCSRTRPSSAPRASSTSTRRRDAGIPRQPCCTGIASGPRPLLDRA